MNNTISNFYDNLAEDYSKGWKRKGMCVINDYELSLVGSALDKVLMSDKNHPKMVLDIGCGSGRIANVLTTKANILYHGIDIAGNMVRVVKDNCKSKNNFVEAKQNNISKGIKYSDDSFDFISCIRVLKYNKNWRWILGDIYRVLKKDGVLIFTIPNRFSLNYFARGSLPMYGTTIREINKLLKDIGFTDVSIARGFKIPDVFYVFTNNKVLLKSYVFLENLLYRLIGLSFSRILYITCRK